jgi:hypothetical protein
MILEGSQLHAYNDVDLSMWFTDSMQFKLVSNFVANSIDVPN